MSRGEGKGPGGPKGPNGPEGFDGQDREGIERDLNKRLERLLNSGIDTEEIARILDAENFLLYPGGKHGGVIFDFRSFIQAELRKAKPLALPEDAKKINDTILPPDEGEMITGSGEGIEEKGTIPRTKYLIEVLTELGFDYNLVDGQNTSTMMRQHSYKVFIIPGIGKIAFVNNGEDNATFIIHKLEAGQSWEDYYGYRKDELKKRIPEGTVGRVIWSNPADWKARMTELLQLSSEQAVGQKPEKVPEDWVTDLQLARALTKENSYKVPVYIVITLADRNKRTYSEGFIQTETPKGFPRYHYSPELQSIIRSRLSNLSRPPQGWLTIVELAGQIPMAGRMLDNSIRKVGKERSDWFDYFVNKKNEVEQHYSQNLVAAIFEYLQPFMGDVPPGRPIS